MKRFWIYAVLFISLVGCVAHNATTNPPGYPAPLQTEPTPEYEVYKRHQRVIFDTFDTLIIVMGYAQSDEEFSRWAGIIEDELRWLHVLFDIYNDYEGINNLKTINDNAGIVPIEVNAAVIDLLIFAQQAYQDSGGVVNVALGSVLCIWSRYRQDGIVSPEAAVLPSMESLQAASAHTSIDDIVIDLENATVFLRDSEMSLDVGALAKGFAIHSAMELAQAEGFFSGLINAGGDVIVIGAPMSERDYWAVGVRDPASLDADSMYDVLHITGDMAVATSGSNQRFFVVDGMNYNHIIDPDTLMPADSHASVTVIHPDARVAEMLSTAAFILPQDEGERLLTSFGAEGIWISSDGSFVFTRGYVLLSRNF